MRLTSNNEPVSEELQERIDEDFNNFLIRDFDINNPPKGIGFDTEGKTFYDKDPFPMREINKEFLKGKSSISKIAKWIWFLCLLMAIALFVEACVFIILISLAI